MKTVEEKAKAYDEALERAKKLQETCDSTTVVGWCEYIFQELRESKDEKIKKEIINYFAKGKEYLSLCSIGKDDILAWLEKQGEQSSLNINRECLKGIKRVQEYQDLSDWEKEFDKIASMYAHNKNQEGYNDSWYVKERAAEMLYYAKKELEKQGEQKPTLRERYKNIAKSEWFKKTHEGMSVSDDEKVDNVNKIEPKFKVGDWCIDNEDGTIFQIVKVLDNTYTYKTNEGKEYSCPHYSLENDAKLWTIQDAKDGDVLAERLSSGRTIIIIYNGLNEEDTILSHCGYNGSDFVVPKNGIGFGHLEFNLYTPATKEQRNLLFTKMKEAGYEWDSEKKELKKIEQKSWSEEDETNSYHLKTLLENLAKDNKHEFRVISENDRDKYTDWLKSLKQRIGG